MSSNRPDGGDEAGVETNRDNLFLGLRDACFRCGAPPAAPNCEECEDFPPLNQYVHSDVGSRVRCAHSPKPGIIIAVKDGSAKILLRDGPAVRLNVTTLTDHHRLNLARSMAEQLLAASLRWQPPSALDNALCARAVSEAERASSFAQLRFAEAARVVGKSELIDQLDPPTATVSWLDALDMARREHWRDATTTLLTIPGSAFPARIGLWMCASSHLDPATSRRVLEALDHFAGLGTAVDVAVVTLRVALKDIGNPGDVDPTLQQLDTCLSTWDKKTLANLRRRLRGSNDLPEATLLRALESNTSTIESHAHQLQSAPATLIDDLIDDGTIDFSWLDKKLARRLREHVAARTDPSQMSDDGLKMFALADEQARRAVLAGDSLPEDLPASTRERLADLIELTKSPTPADAALAILARKQDPAADALRDALADPATVPSDDALQSSIARFALGTSGVESLDARNLTKSELTARQQTYVGTVLLERAKHALLSWRYEEAVHEAKHCLRLTTDEAIRDEALNLIACGDWQQGNHEAAIGALETALKGEYTYALQANFAVVAQTLNPERAAHHLTRLIEDAPDLRLKVAAAERALLLWQASDFSPDQEDDLPANFARAIRALVRAPIDEADFRSFLRLLADHDATWLQKPESLESSPHASSAAARLYVARARDFEQYVDELAKLLNGGRPASWLSDERDGLLSSIIGALAADEPRLGALSVADRCFERRMPMSTVQRIMLRGLMARSVAAAITKQGDGEPALRFLDELEAAHADLKRLEHPDQHERAADAADWGFRALAVSYLKSRWSQLAEAGDVHDNIADVIARTLPFQRNRSALRKAITTIRELADDTARLLVRLQRHLDDDGKELLEKAIDFSRELRAGADQLRKKV